MAEAGNSDKEDRAKTLVDEVPNLEVMVEIQAGHNGEQEVSVTVESLKLEENDELEEINNLNCDVEEEGLEEGFGAYGLGGFHPVYIRDVYNDRYEIMRKIGYGQYSTVWLVKDLTQEEGNENEYRALKILSADSYDEKHPVFEKEILNRLREEDKMHPGYKYICHLVDDFELQGPNGKHVCFVFELIGETLHTFRLWFREQMLPNYVMRKFTSQLLMALDYAHDSGVIHTDIKPDNIFVKFRDRSLITTFLKESSALQQDKNSKPYVPLESFSLRDFYFAEDDSPLDFDISLGDWGVSSWTTKHLCEVIQPACLRAPEVLIGAPWNATTDWWNLGAVILEVFRAVQMFVGKDSQYALYQVKTHLTEIVELFGPFPRSLLDQGDQEMVRELFDENGTIKGLKPSHGEGLLSDFYMSDLSQETREDFVAFLNELMKIDPKDRLPTQNLLDHPWIQGRN